MISEIDPYKTKKEYLQRVERLKKANENLDGSVPSKKEFIFAKKEVEDMADIVKVAQEILLESDKSALEPLVIGFNDVYKILNNVDTTGWADKTLEQETSIPYIA